jgi:ABC-type transport system involved in cytochrome c biogenesis permease subunit
MSWNEFIWFALPSVVCWLAAGVLVYQKKQPKLPLWLMLAGIVIFAGFIVALWLGQARPPMKTTGETRLWYSFFLSSVGLITWLRWKYNWMLSFSALVASVFALINIFKPEIHFTHLMPALQSPWFVPHVTVYILSYSLFGAATVASVVQLVKLYRSKPDAKLYAFMDNMVYAGMGLLMLGMFMGALWAKEAWGHYWEWDPKETWAGITATAYLIYIHMRRAKGAPKTTVWILPLAFILLMITWLGVELLPAAQESMHTY